MHKTVTGRNQTVETVAVVSERPRNRPASRVTNCNCPVGALANLLIDGLLADIEASFTVDGRFRDPAARHEAARRCSLLSRSISSAVSGTTPISSELKYSINMMIGAPIKNIEKIISVGREDLQVDDLVFAAGRE